LEQTPEHTVLTPGKTTQPVGFFQEDNGNRSSMRLMSFAALIAAIVFGLITTLGVGSGPEGIYITFGFLLAAFAPKALQKFAESQALPSKR